MKMWSKVQCDPFLHEFTQEICQKEEKFEQMEATMPTLIPTQRLPCLQANHALRDDQEELLQKNKVLSDHLKPWADETLKIYQDLDVVVKKMNQTLKSVITATEGRNFTEVGGNCTERCRVERRSVAPFG